MNWFRKRLTAIAVVAALGGVVSNAVAGGLGIGTQSGSGTGNAFDGGSAYAEDASVVWYNPAGMSMLPGKTNFAVAAHLLKPSFKFQNQGSTGLFAAPGSGDGGDGGGWHLIPQGYVAHKLTEKWSIGAGFNTPFGLETEYDTGWRGQAIALKSTLKIYNLALTGAYRVNDMFSVGAGFNYQRAELKFNSQTPFGFVEPDLSDDSTGWNIGAVFQPTPQTRIGAHYRSAVNYQATGTLIAPAALGGSSGASAGFTTPDSFSLSAFHALSPKWEIMADMTWTGWSHVKQLDVLRTTGAAAGTRGAFIVFNWDDTMRYSVGANYKYDDRWKIRFGVAFDETPTNDVDRTARLPDQDRQWVAIGAQLKMSRNGKLDFAYAHEFIKDASVNNAFGASRLIGSFENQADIFSIQYSHSF